MTSDDHNTSIPFDSLKLIVKPVVRFLIRHSLTLNDLIRVAKVAFVEAVAEEMEQQGLKTNVSRLSVRTGVHRKDVTRIYREKQPPQEPEINILGRVIGQWRHSKKYTTPVGGNPRILSHREFQELVVGLNKNINAGTVLFELKRIGTVEQTSEGYKLVRQMPGVAADPTKAFQLLSQDLDTLIGGIEENALAPKDVANLHIRTEYDNILQDQIPTIRQWLIDEGKIFHKRIREYLSQFDQDITPNTEHREAGARVTVTAFSLSSWPVSVAGKTGVKGKLKEANSPPDK